VIVSAVAFLLAACTVQVAAPRPNDTPTPTATATPRPTNASSDLLYLRSLGSYGQGTIRVVDAGTGATLRTMPGGAVSADRTTLFSSEAINGATQTLVRLTDLASGNELRTFTIDGDLRPATFTGSLHELFGTRLTADTRNLVLVNTPYKSESGWVTRLGVADVSAGALVGSTEIVTPFTYSVLALSPDGRSVYVDQYGEGPARTRVFDVASGALMDLSGSGLVASGFRTSGVLSRDGRWLFRVDVGDPGDATSDSSYVVALDLIGRLSLKIPLSPGHKPAGFFEGHHLWSVALSPDGTTLYAVNPAIGAVNEIDAVRMTLKRTEKITLSRASAGPFTALGRLFFPLAEAKRAIIGGAALSPDGRMLFAAGHKGIAVIDTATLQSRTTWQKTYECDLVALSADGLRLYTVDNASRRLSITDTRDGSDLGHITLDSFIAGVVRIDSAR
jgi:DNA-binding beta-propeller fold protein YncE